MRAMPREIDSHDMVLLGESIDEAGFREECVLRITVALSLLNTLCFLLE